MFQYFKLYLQSSNHHDAEVKQTLLQFRNLKPGPISPGSFTRSLDNKTDATETTKTCASLLSEADVVSSTNSNQYIKALKWG